MLLFGHHRKFYSWSIWTKQKAWNHTKSPRSLRSFAANTYISLRTGQKYMTYWFKKRT